MKTGEYIFPSEDIFAVAVQNNFRSCRTFGRREGFDAGLRGKVVLGGGLLSVESPAETDEK